MQAEELAVLCKLVVVAAVVNVFPGMGCIYTFDSRKDGNNKNVKTLTSNLREVCLRVPLGGQAEPVIRESSDVVIQTDMAQLRDTGCQALPCSTNVSTQVKPGDLINNITMSLCPMCGGDGGGDEDMGPWLGCNKSGCNQLWVHARCSA